MNTIKGNGLGPAIIRIKGRVLLWEEKFQEWVLAQQDEKKLQEWLAAQASKSSDRTPGSMTLLTVRQYSERHPEFSPGSLRSLIFQAEDRRATAGAGQ